MITIYAISIVLLIACVCIQISICSQVFTFQNYTISLLLDISLPMYTVTDVLLGCSKDFGMELSSIIE